MDVGGGLLCEGVRVHERAVLRGLGACVLCRFGNVAVRRRHARM